MRVRGETTMYCSAPPQGIPRPLAWPLNDGNGGSPRPRLRTAPTLSSQSPLREDGGGASRHSAAVR